MEMKLIELLDRIDDFTNYVRVHDVYGELLTDYDGRNAVDVKYNNWDVDDFVVRGDLVIIWIAEPKEV